MHLQPSFCEDFKGPSRTGGSRSPLGGLWGGTLIHQAGPGGSRKKAGGTDPGVLGSPHLREVQPASPRVAVGDDGCTTV